MKQISIENPNYLSNDGEKIICERFLTLYNIYGNTNINFVRLGNPNNKEPDCVCTDDISIELVGVYDNEYQAEKMMSKKRSRKSFDARLLSLENLPKEIGKKLWKLEKGNYDNISGPILLVCNLQSPLIEDKEVEDYILEHYPFRKNGSFKKYFDQIWIFWKSPNNGECKIKKLE